MKMHDWRLKVLVAVMALFLVIGVQVRSSAQTTIDSANCNYWDVEDANSYRDTGDISDGGQDAFDDWGSLRIRVLDGSANVLVNDGELCGFGLTWDEDRRWYSQTPVEAHDYSYCGGDRPVFMQDGGKLKVGKASEAKRPHAVAPPDSGIMVSRDLYAPLGTDYMRYLDTFENTSGALRDVYLGWGGNLGSDEDTTIAAASSGHLAIDTADHWAVTIENYDYDPAGPATDPPVGYAFRGEGDTTFVQVGDYYSNPFDTPWSGNGNDSNAFVYHFTLQPGQTVRLAYFLYRGIEEERESPICGGGGPYAPEFIPAAGTEITKAKNAVTALVANPDFGDLAPDVRASILNWPETAYGNSFWDDTNRSQFCVDFTTGDYKWNILAGNGAGTSYTGIGTVLNGNQKVYSKPGAADYLNFTYDIRMKRAYGYLITSASIYSALRDKLTTNDPPGCGSAPPPSRARR